MPDTAPRPSRASGAPALPPLDDEDLRERLEPLRRAVLPQERAGEGAPAPAAPKPPPPAPAGSGKARKPPRENLSFKLPEAVRARFKLFAAQEDTTATLILMEILSGRRPVGDWPITDDDFIDLRREPRGTPV